MPEQPLPVCPRYVACANDRSPVGVLKPVQHFEGFREFFRRGGHLCQRKGSVPAAARLACLPRLNGFRRYPLNRGRAWENVADVPETLS